MGMFDNVKIAKELIHTNKDFEGQTKNLLCKLKKFRITKKDKLKINMNDHWLNYPYDGVLEVYGFNSKNRGWTEYHLYYTYGKLVSIKGASVENRQTLTDQNFKTIEK